MGRGEGRRARGGWVGGEARFTVRGCGHTYAWGCSAACRRVTSPAPPVCNRNVIATAVCARAESVWSRGGGRSPAICGGRRATRRRTSPTPVPRLSCLPAPRPLKTSPRKREPTYRLTRARARTGRLAGSSFDGAAHTWRQRLWGAGPRGTGCGWCGCWSVEGPGRFKFTRPAPLQRTRPRRCAHRQPATVRRANYVNRPPRPCRLWRRVVLHQLNPLCLRCAALGDCDTVQRRCLRLAGGEHAVVASGNGRRRAPPPPRRRHAAGAGVRRAVAQQAGGVQSS